jgi:hypothetical protein
LGCLLFRPFDGSSPARTEGARAERAFRNRDRILLQIAQRIRVVVALDAARPTGKLIPGKRSFCQLLKFRHGHFLILMNFHNNQQI